MARKILTEEQRLARNKYARGWASQNKEKCKAHVRKWQRENPDKRREVTRRWRENNPARVSAMRAKRRGLSWGLSDLEYADLKKKPCFYCGSNLPDSEGGLDRIDNSKGYEPGNVLPCCYSCNVTRSDIYSVEETKIMIDALLKFRKGGDY